MTAWLPTVTIASAVALAAPALGQDATFTWLTQAFSANDMTPDGRIVVGSGVGGAYYWTLEDGYTWLPGGGNAVSISDGGTVILGNVDDPDNPGHNVGAVWHQTDEGWERTTFGGLPTGLLCPSVSSAYELSGDGNVAVGLAWIDGCDAVATRWTVETGLVGMEHLANGGNRASVVSYDGSIAGGFAQGSGSRTPAIWFADGTGQLLDPPDGDAGGEVRGMSDDGSILLGSWNQDLFSWTAEDGVQIFSSLIASWAGAPMDIADDGTIVGFDFALTSRIAWIKFPGEDPVNFRTYLANELGVDGLPPNIDVIQAISTNGRVIIGHNGPFSNGFVVNIPASADIDGDGVVGFQDLLLILAAWGPCGTPCPEDLDGDSIVGFPDLLILLSKWG
jgi:uncharacterized membrane protein